MEPWTYATVAYSVSEDPERGTLHWIDVDAGEGKERNRGDLDEFHHTLRKFADEGWELFGSPVVTAWRALPRADGGTDFQVVGCRAELRRRRG